jgi:hypothetical protein
MMPDEDEVRREATQRHMDWGKSGVYADWKRQVGGHVRAIWRTLTDEQKVAIALDAKARARKDEEAEEVG